MLEKMLESDCFVTWIQKYLAVVLKVMTCAPVFFGIYVRHM